MANIKTPETLQDAIVYFADPERAFVYAVNLRWPSGVITCPRCGGDKHSFVKTRLLWFCKGCKKQFTVKVGTIFEDSPIGLDKWMTGMWMLVNCKNGISSYELHRSLGITQKSAWFMLQRLRLVLEVGSLEQRKLGGPGNEVELDETFVGGKAINMHKARRLRYEQLGGHHGKTIVQGILDRDLRQIRATVVPNIKRETLQNEVLKTFAMVPRFTAITLWATTCSTIGLSMSSSTMQSSTSVAASARTAWKISGACSREP